MRRERVSEEIYVFTSEAHVQVTAGVLVTDEGAIVIDTLPFPFEGQEMKEFIEKRCPQGVRFVINTHRHPDHVNGNYLFPEAIIIGHRLCREGLLRDGEAILAEGKSQTPELAPVQLRAPDLVFDESLGLHLGQYSLLLQHMPGHSPDVITAFVEGEKILFASDAITPLPYIVWGDWRDARQSLVRVREMTLESIVQGHGEILLRGEIPDIVQTHIAYLECITDGVREIVKAGGTPDQLRSITLEDCGESPIPLDGIVRQMHEGNLRVLYQEFGKEAGLVQHRLGI